MEAKWIKVNGENAFAFIPANVDELRTMLAQHGGTLECEDCESPTGVDDTICPTCGEGLGSPEFRPVSDAPTGEPDGEPQESFDYSDDGDALASAGMGTDEDYGGWQESDFDGGE